MAVLEDVMQGTRDTASVRRVFGEPIERDGTTVVPVASVWSGGGGGEGGDESAEASGSGGGFGVIARPLGVYVIRDGDVQWRPAVDVMRIVLGSMLLAAVGIVFGTRVARR